MIRLTVKGKPAPQGSKRMNRYGAVFESSAAVKPWREAVRSEAQRAIAEPLTGPVEVWVTFYRARPKSHYRTGRYAHLLRDTAPPYPTGKPDSDKLARAVLDGLTDGRAWEDDSQVTDLHALKRWGPPGCQIEMWELKT